MRPMRLRIFFADRNLMRFGLGQKRLIETLDKLFRRLTCVPDEPDSFFMGHDHITVLDIRLILNPKSGDRSNQSGQA